MSPLRAPATAALGAMVALVGLGLGLESVLLPGVALLLLATVAFWSGTTMRVVGA